MRKARMEAKDRIIFALDTPGLPEALSYVDILKDDVGLFKIGLELFVKDGPGAVLAIKEAAPKAGIFLDLKFHDIPATMRGALRSTAALGASFLTVHLSEGSASLREFLKERPVGATILGVTVLTSTSYEDLSEIGLDTTRYLSTEALVVERARMARGVGVDGIVCSPLEARAVRTALGPDFTIVTPGIRLADDDSKDDQRRIATPGSAIRDGADYIVVGRPIRDAEDPALTARRIATEIDVALTTLRPS